MLSIVPVTPVIGENEVIVGGGQVGGTVVVVFKLFMSLVNRVEIPSSIFLISLSAFLTIFVDSILRPASPPANLNASTNVLSNVANSDK